MKREYFHPAFHRLIFGNIGSNIEVCDPEAFKKKPKKEIKGLRNFYMCGQWADNGGLPSVLTSGRDVAQIICKRDGKKFRTNQY
ncbi:hypothetical protein METP3_00060 [Methanosarcinales archaeon]|nr:hypothetical protein METP3_00060 [Methanosarcinales archaeon]